MSDGPTKLAPPGAPELDDIILGEDDQTVPIPPVAARSSAVPPAIEADAPRRDRSSNRVKAAEPAKDAGKDTKKRQKMTLRIPDDEVSRPQLPSSTPMYGVPAVTPSRPPSSPDFGGARPPSSPELGGRPGSSPELARAPSPPNRPGTEAAMAVPLRPNRIISVGAADDTLELPAVDLKARGSTIGERFGDPPPQRPPSQRAPGLDATQESGWTPYQPTVADAPVTAPVAMRDPAKTMIDEPGAGAMGAMAAHASGNTRHRAQETPSVPPASEDIPIDTDEDDDSLRHDRSDELTTNPRLPAALDSEEIKLDDGERHTDPGEVPEVAPEDLVSVESIPNPHSPHAPPPLKGGAKPVIASNVPAVTASSIVSVGGALPPAPIVVTPLAPAVGPKAPSVPAPPNHDRGGAPNFVPAIAQAPLPQAPAPQVSPPQPSSPQPSTPQPTLRQPEAEIANPVAGRPMARRQQPAGGPFGFMPAVGALAPPAMNESAAHRKKTRPWWEDLFNDDFIRTMAKITDADIAREANFIEESLGCEAGATILDLACGTGRHAVELASRGYQVVGFDLSLAMLARASDEAQDRKQKINFVQGDMRDMTFEETFDGIFSWNTSFGFFDEEKNATVIAKVHRALKKGGQFLLDVVNRDSLIRSAPSLAWFEGDGCICMDEMQIDFITSRMKVKRTLMMDDGRTKEIEYSIRVYSLHELGKMLHDNGFRVAEVSGRTGTPGVFFGCESPRTLILAEKR